MIESMPAMASYVSKLYEERVKDMVGRYVAAKGPRKLGALKVVQRASNAAMVTSIEEGAPMEKMEVDEATGGTRSGEERLSPVTIETTIPNTLDFELKSESISEVVDAKE